MGRDDVAAARGARSGPVQVLYFWDVSRADLMESIEAYFPGASAGMRRPPCGRFAAELVTGTVADVEEVDRLIAPARPALAAPSGSRSSTGRFLRLAVWELRQSRR